MRDSRKIELTLAEDDKRVWKYWIDKHRGRLTATVWEYHKELGALTHSLFEDWTWSTFVPCERATAKAIMDFGRVARAQATLAVAERRAQLAIPVGPDGMRL